MSQLVRANLIIKNHLLYVEGRRHDAPLLVESVYSTVWSNMLYHTQANHCASTAILTILSGYILQSPYRAAVLTPQMREFNRSMSAVRVSVEWLFGDIINYFKFVDFKKNLKIGLSAVGKMYVVCAIIRNALTCLYGNQTSHFFDL